LEPSTTSTRGAALRSRLLMLALIKNPTTPVLRGFRA